MTCSSAENSGGEVMGAVNTENRYHCLPPLWDCHSIEAHTNTGLIRVRGKEEDMVTKRKGIKGRGKVRLS